MTRLVRSPAELLAALDELVAERVDTAVVTAQKEVVAYCYREAAWGKATWVHPDDFWTGQFRSSWRVSVDDQDSSFTPTHPDVEQGKIEWPEHPANPYMPTLDADVVARLDGLQPYQTVYLTNNAPHAETVEMHTKVANAAAVFTRSHFGPGYSWGTSLLSTEIPF